VSAHPRVKRTEVTFDLTGSVAVVVGASRGIGEQVAQAFADAGAAVMLGARDGAALTAGVGAIEASGGTAAARVTDVTSVDDCRALVESAIDTFGRLDFAFNNAADGPAPAPLAQIDPTEFDRGVATTLGGAFLGMKFQIPAMLESGGRAVVNMASVAGLVAHANLAAYVASKAAVIGLTKAAALDYADHNVRINAIAPGTILTHRLAAAGQMAIDMGAYATPMRRIGSPAEVADAVLWLCSPASSFVTGAVIAVDGGMAAGTKPVGVSPRSGANPP
jgi:NAD(P)-dependent dehydrogenase (short-subunit alcohol dehydrogenase family)